MSKYHLIASKACGSMIVEAALALAKLPHEVEMIPYVEPGPQRDRLLALNPLGQVPTLVLPDGRALTESAAIILHVADQAPQAGLIPAAKDPARPMFLRWLEFIVAAIYPTFSYGDDPKRWAGDEAAGKHLRKATDEHRKELWRYFAAQNPCKPWVLGRDLLGARSLCRSDEHVAAWAGLVQEGVPGARGHRRAGVQAGCARRGVGAERGLTNRATSPPSWQGSRPCHPRVSMGRIAIDSSKLVRLPKARHRRRRPTG